MKQIAPSVPFTQPSLVPPSAEQSHTSLPAYPPPDHHHYQGAKRGRYSPVLKFDSRVGVSRLQTYPRLAHASSALGRQLFKNPIPLGLPCRYCRYCRYYRYCRYCRYCRYVGTVGTLGPFPASTGRHHNVMACHYTSREPYVAQRIEISPGFDTSGSPECEPKCVCLPERQSGQASSRSSRFDQSAGCGWRDSRGSRGQPHRELQGS